MFGMMFELSLSVQLTQGEVSLHLMVSPSLTTDDVEMENSSAFNSRLKMLLKF